MTKKNTQLSTETISELIEISNKIYLLSVENNLEALLSGGLSERGSFGLLLKDFINSLKALRGNKAFFDYIKNERLPEIKAIERILIDFLKLEKRLLVEMGVSQEYSYYLLKKISDLIQEIESSGSENWFWPAPWTAKSRARRSSRMSFLLSEAIYLLEEAYDLSRKYESRRKWMLVRGVLRKSSLFVGGVVIIIGDASFLAPGLGLSSAASALSIFLGEKMAERAFESK